MAVLCVGVQTQAGKGRKNCGNTYNACEYVEKNHKSTNI